MSEMSVMILSPVSNGLCPIDDAYLATLPVVS